MIGNAEMFDYIDDCQLTINNDVGIKNNLRNSKAVTGSDSD
ncbi:hypothetical protein GCM10019993_22110 [Enterococcus pseudoavium]